MDFPDFQHTRYYHPHRDADAEGVLTSAFRLFYDIYARVENLKIIFLYKFKTNEVSLARFAGRQDEVPSPRVVRDSPSD